MVHHGISTTPSTVILRPYKAAVVSWSQRRFSMVPGRSVAPWSASTYVDGGAYGQSFADSTPWNTTYTGILV
jgi:hypothetical protein